MSICINDGAVPVTIASPVGFAYAALTTFAGNYNPLLYCLIPFYTP